MMHRISVRSTVEQPAGRSAVVVPDVFPATPQDDLANVHDILQGALPYPATDSNRRGWLRLAMPTGEHPAYIDPSLEQDEQRKILEGFRDSEKGEVVIDDIEEVMRGMLRLDDLTAKIHMSRASVYFPRPERTLFRVWSVESALAFTGRITLQGNQQRIFGMHFRSGKEHGWARVLEPGENDGEPAKLQHEPVAVATYEQILSTR